MILFEDLIELNNLEYLNLENNSLSSIDSQAFFNLGRLNTLILSSNKLNHLNEIFFDDLSNLKFLNLSWNSIEFIKKYLFKELFKLETIDLSFNRIRFIENFSFFKLTYLRNLHLNDNDENIFIDSNSFYELESIQNVFISKFALNSNLTKSIMIKLFEYKNRNFFKKVLKRSYFKSLFLISSYENDFYDCDLNLYFLQNNVHFNFKTGNDFFYVENQCIGLTIEKRLKLTSDFFLGYDGYIAWAVLFDLYLLFVLVLGIILLYDKAPTRPYLDLTKIYRENTLKFKWKLAFKLIKKQQS